MFSILILDMRRIKLLKNRRSIIYFLIAAAAVIFLTPNLAQADSGYRRGLQHLYPYYIPNGENQIRNLNESYPVTLIGDNDTQKVKNFARRYIGLNELGGIIFGAALYNASGLDPKFNDQSYCGLAAWDCRSERWQRLLNFSESHSLDHLDLKTQLIFINLELNALSSSEGSRGEYQYVYENLKTADDFVISSSVFMQNYLNQTPINLTSLAGTLYDYEPPLEYNEDDSPAEPEEEPEEPVIAPEPPPSKPIEPVTSPPVAPANPAANSTAVGQENCRVGTAGGYIAVSHASDSQGRFLISLLIINWKNSSKLTSTLIHRCLRDSIQDMLSNYNSQVTSNNKIGGWGWRSHARQIELREKHCGTSNYDIWEKPASQCRPPTARPGYSSHQDGLAIDFYCNNTLLQKNNCSGAFKWLDCHAAEYGLINLPSEPWHWYYPLNKPYKLAEKLRAGC